MQGEAVWQRSDKRSSGLFSVLRWLRGQGDPLEPPPAHGLSSSSSSASISSASSSDTVASFSFVPPGSYRPHGRAHSPPRMYILPQPETPTYKARLAERELRRRADHQLTLRTKYNLPTPDSNERHLSLPLMTKGGEGKPSHRRTASESATHAHVRGKRRAPQPPLQKLTDNTARRKKRMAPQPPPTSHKLEKGGLNPAKRPTENNQSSAVLQVSQFASATNSNDSLKLENGVLKPTKTPTKNSQSVVLQDTISNDSLKLEKGVLKPAKQPTENNQPNVVVASQFAPRPWYKRNKLKSDPDKRKSSNMSFLTNISELDRQTMEILERETLKMKYLRGSQAPAFMKPKATDSTASNSDSWLSPKRRSARDLIAKFNAITGVKTTKESVQVELVEKEERSAEPKRSLPSSPVARGALGAASRPNRTPWNCPRCKLHNEYWRIICRVCSAIKPYFDDFDDKTKDVQYKSDKLAGSLVTNNELAMFNKQIFERLPTNSNVQAGAVRSYFEDAPDKTQYKGDKLEASLVTNSELATFSKQISEKLPINSNIQPGTVKPYFDDVTDKTKDASYKSDRLESSPVTNQIFGRLPTNSNLPSSSNNGTKTGEMLQPRYPLSKFDLLEQTSNDSGQFQRINRIQKSVSQSSVGVVRSDTKPEPKTSILDQILKDIKQNKRETEKTEASLQMSPFETEQLHVNREKYDNFNDKPKIERIILGDEINVSNGSKGEERNLKIVENMGFGEEINVTDLQQPSKKEGTCKKEEREALKKMLIEMKNSLSKRSVNKIKEDRKNRVSVVCEEQNTEEGDNSLPEKSLEIIVVTQETTYENIKVI